MYGADHSKQLKIPLYRVSSSVIVFMRGRGSKRHNTGLSSFDFECPLRYEKATARWILCLPTTEEKRYRVKNWKVCLALFNDNQDKILQYFMTVAKT